MCVCVVAHVKQESLIYLSFSFSVPTICSQYGMYGVMMFQRNSLMHKDVLIFNHNLWCTGKAKMTELIHRSVEAYFVI